MIDQLASEYAGRAVFIEYNVDAFIAQDRVDRWWYSYGGTQSGLPLTMVDSGYRTHAGFSTVNQSYAQHKQMVEDALARPPQALLAATWKRVGNAVEFTVQLTNQSGVTLSLSNEAAVFAIVYEDAPVQYTQRFARAVAAQSISPGLANNASRSFTLTTEALSGVDWSKLHMLVVVDYFTLNHFETLQAALATAPIQAAPAMLFFRAPVGGPNPAGQAVSLSGGAGTGWTAESSAAWLRSTPTSGTLPAAPLASINVGGLSAGIYTGTLTYTIPSGEKAQAAALAAIGDLEWIYLPVIKR